MATSKGFRGQFVVSFLALLFISFTLADDSPIHPPSFVYRSDFRPPSEIFKDGFKHLGENEHLIDHVIGDSCKLGALKNTAFVATSHSEDTARAFGISLLWTVPDGGDNIYLYKIRATEFFFDVNSSLKKAYKSTGNKEYLELANLFKTEQEWIAYQGIPRDLIVSVSVFRKGRSLGKGEFVRSEQNELYVPENTKGNSDVFPVNRVSKAVNLVANNMEIPMSVCFASCPASKARTTCNMKEVVYKTDLSNQKASYWDAVERRHEEGFLPWKEIRSSHGRHKEERPEGCTIRIVGSALKIKCHRNKFYEEFRVYLSGGTRGKQFHTKHKDGKTGKVWQVTARELRMLAGAGTLGNHGTIVDVFSGAIWWSEIRIYPVYPVMKF